MALDELRRLIVRRWYLVVAAVLIAAVGGVAGYLATPPKFEAKATMLLLPSPASSGGAQPINPYLALGGGLTMTADVLALEVTDTPVVQSLFKEGYRAAYTVTPDTTVGAPVLAVTATDSDRAMAASTLNAVMRTIGQRLHQDQVAAKAPKNSYVSVHTLVQSPQPTALVKGPIRTGIMGALLGLLLGLVPLAVVEMRARRRAGTQPATGDRPVATLAALAPSAPVEEPLPEPEEARVRRPRPQVSRARSGTGERPLTTLSAVAPPAPVEEPLPESAEARGRSSRPRVARARSSRPRAFGADG
jgi:hypothetical protein